MNDVHKIWFYYPHDPSLLHLGTVVQHTINVTSLTCLLLKYPPSPNEDVVWEYLCNSIALTLHHIWCSSWILPRKLKHHICLHNLLAEMFIPNTNNTSIFVVKSRWTTQLEWWWKIGKPSLYNTFLALGYARKNGSVRRRIGRSSTSGREVRD